MSQSVGAAPFSTSPQAVGYSPNVVNGYPSPASSGQFPSTDNADSIILAQIRESPPLMSSVQHPDFGKSPYAAKHTTKKTREDTSGPKAALCASVILALSAFVLASIYFHNVLSKPSGQHAGSGANLSHASHLKPVFAK